MSQSLLEVSGLRAGYGNVQVLRDVSFTIGRNEVVVLLGSNGAGKTTAMRAIAGLLPFTGEARLDGVSLRGRSAEQRTRLGIALVPQGRGTFVNMTVDENLRIGAYSRRDRRAADEQRERWLEVFPRLADRLPQLAGSLSGGEQQMLAVVRALMSNPRLLLLDEPSLGLSPIMTQELFAQLGELAKTGKLSMLIVEQTAELALGIADRAHVLTSGYLSASRPAAELLTGDALRQAYLGG
ncbi:ABC transporter ATP-binding protein [Microbacterium immunditiarum]|uniref:Branched-chain amino acid transport system ATP-binding protein n=1 Tax=Microbacterium immunditiarum TaxID=337480 RepID=A0A7Y9GRV1_9MICO|nr:ABC transporter ATP-binding protein [Microbacterium immunditiarum]NYE21543.1 branched-chain amino acid transport system ATP-binding protein [Microbacterium immunditiarum]